MCNGFSFFLSFLFPFMFSWNVLWSGKGKKKPNQRKTSVWIIAWKWYWHEFISPAFFFIYYSLYMMLKSWPAEWTSGEDMIGTIHTMPNYVASNPDIELHYVVFFYFFQVERLYGVLCNGVNHIIIKWNEWMNENFIWVYHTFEQGCIGAFAKA